MIREPHYSVDTESLLNKLERGSDTRLLNAVCDALDVNLKELNFCYD